MAGLDIILNVLAWSNLHNLVFFKETHVIVVEVPPEAHHNLNSKAFIDVFETTLETLRQFIHVIQVEGRALQVKG